MRRFMQRDREQDWQRPDRKGRYQRVHQFGGKAPEFNRAVGLRGKSLRKSTPALYFGALRSES